MRGLFATAELAPFVKVGGLGDAASGLVKALRRQDIEVEVVLPDYGWLPLEQTDEQSLDVPDWAGPARVRRGSLNGFGNVSLVVTPTMARPHPYNDAEGRGWPGNDTRFFSFSAAVAALARADAPDVLHLNDWHTGAVLGFASHHGAQNLAVQRRRELQCHVHVHHRRDTPDLRRLCRREIEVAQHHLQPRLVPLRIGEEVNAAGRVAVSVGGDHRKVAGRIVELLVAAAVFLLQVLALGRRGCSKGEDSNRESGNAGALTHAGWSRGPAACWYRKL